MIKLEEFVNEKLRVSKNSESSRIKTTLRKFLAWFTGKDEYHINRYDLEERNFISSNKSMSFGDKTDFLYKHINDTIYMSEEEKLTHTETGLSGMAKSKLYDYSFEIDGITFNIDARIYGDDELLSNNRQYIITEKLKVSTKDINSIYSLEDFDFDRFKEELETCHPISVSPFLDDGEEIGYLYFGKYILQSIHSGVQNNSPDSIIFVFEKENDKRSHEIKHINSMEELLDMSKTLSGDFLKLIQDIYNAVISR
jgi:hypothetical protein